MPEAFHPHDRFFRISFARPDVAAFQLLRYCLRIWEREQRAEPGAGLPPIVPVVVYNGARPWSAARNVRELVGGPEALRGHGPDFGFERIDLAALPEPEIVGEVRLRVALLALKPLRRPDAGRQLPRLAKLLRDVSERSTVPGLLHALLSYAAGFEGAISTDDLRRAERIALPELGGGSVASLIEQWKAEGLAEGRAGMVEAIRVALELKHGPAGLALMPRIESIEDWDRLQALPRMIQRSSSLEALAEMLG